LNALDDLMWRVYSQALRSNGWRHFDEDKDDMEIKKIKVIQLGGSEVQMGIW